MTVIKHKRGAGVPLASSMEVGELAIDTAEAKLYTKIGGSIVELGGGQLSETNQNIDGGGASAIYVLDQIINGGSA